MRLTLDVTVITAGDDVERSCTVRLPASYGDRAAFEAEFRVAAVALDVAVGQILRAATDDPSFEAALALHDRWVAFLAWRQLRRADPTLASTFPMFEMTIEEVRVNDARIATPEAVDPTVPAAVSAPVPPLT